MVDPPRYSGLNRRKSYPRRARSNLTTTVPIITDNHSLYSSFHLHHLEPKLINIDDLMETKPKTVNRPVIRTCTMYACLHQHRALVQPSHTTFCGLFMTRKQCAVQRLRVKSQECTRPGWVGGVWLQSQVAALGSSRRHGEGTFVASACFIVAHCASNARSVVT